MNTNGMVEGGRWVRIQNLQSPKGRELNGKVGQVVRESPNDEGRYPIRIDGNRDCKLVKPGNFVDVPRNEMAKVCRLPARGEGSFVGDTNQPKVLLFPREHSMFACEPGGNSPAMEMAGLPLMVKKTAPYTDLSGWGDTDNQKATYLMIRPHDGLAPAEWQSGVGPTLVYRPGGSDFGYHDLWAVHSFLCNLLDRYGDGVPRGFDPRSWINPSGFQWVIRQEPFVNLLNILADEGGEDGEDDYDDVD